MALRVRDAAARESPQNSNYFETLPEDIFSIREYFRED
jgi:hypothetical protein